MKRGIGSSTNPTSLRPNRGRPCRHLQAGWGALVGRPIILTSRPPIWCQFWCQLVWQVEAESGSVGQSKSAESRIIADLLQGEASGGNLGQFARTHFESAACAKSCVSLRAPFSPIDRQADFGWSRDSYTGSRFRAAVASPPARCAETPATRPGRARRCERAKLRRAAGSCLRRSGLRRRSCDGASETGACRPEPGRIEGAATLPLVANW
jgi:hypothetical protein